MAEEKMEAVPVIITGPDGQEREYVEEKVIVYTSCMISACVYNKLFLYISVPPFYYFAFKTTELLEFTSPFPLPKIKGLHKANDFLAKVDYFC